tara:strand:- start:780 stop:1373 length:594 start_codon:yes stop_codon:yes gene_type:complete
MIYKCNTCDIELNDNNWSDSWKRVRRTQCKKCSKKNNDRSNPVNNPVNNPKSMYVNGIYVSRKHPLHKAGRYKSFGDAAFASLSNYTTSKEGEVYVITNKAWDGWVKIGMAVDAVDRLNSYQTSSPHRDYILIHKEFFSDRRRAEAQAHREARKVAKKHNSEWFKLDVYTATLILKGLDKSMPDEVKQLTGAFEATQ